MPVCRQAGPAHGAEGEGIAALPPRLFSAAGNATPARLRRAPRRGGGGAEGEVERPRHATARTHMARTQLFCGSPGAQGAVEDDVGPPPPHRCRWPGGSTTKGDPRRKK
jgi:hypothetical protein